MRSSNSYEQAKSPTAFFNIIHYLKDDNIIGFMISIRAKNEAFLKKRADRDENSPTASTQTTKKIRPTFRPASVLLRNESMVSSSLASSASPRSLCFDLAEESIEAVGKEDANNTIFAPRSGKEAEEVKEEDKEDHELLNNFCEDELFVESHFLAAAKLMLEFEEDA